MRPDALTASGFFLRAHREALREFAKDPDGMPGQGS